MEKASEALQVAFSCPSLQARGNDHQEIVIEALCMRGKQELQMTGMVDSSLQESLEKIRCLLRQKNCWGPTSQVVLHLLPPEVPKFGAHLEFPLYALSLLALRSQEIDIQKALERLAQRPLAASLTLDGRLLHTAYSERLCQERQDVVGADHFSHVDEFEAYLFRENPELPPPQRPTVLGPAIPEVAVAGLELERFWLFLAALWESPVLLIGPPGVGKSHLARWAHTLLPTLDDGEFRQCLGVWKSSELSLNEHRPFLAPHSRTRFPDFIGTSTERQQRPGLYALAHRGLLVLDEFTELNRDCRELLRTVLDEKRVLRHTRSGSVIWNAEFWLILTANPCECGYAQGRDLSRCVCSRGSLKNYQSRLSGPLLDRMLVKRFVRERMHPDARLIKLVRRISDLNSADLRQRLPLWRKKLREPKPQTTIEKTLLERARSNRDRENKERWLRALQTLELFSEREIEILIEENLEHEQRYFQDAGIR